MAYREVAMWEILNVLERLARRESKTVIARATGHSRSTVRRYERVARALGWNPEIAAPTEALAAEVAQRLTVAGDREAGEREAELLPHIDVIRKWLTRTSAPAEAIPAGESSVAPAPNGLRAGSVTGS